MQIVGILLAAGRGERYDPTGRQLKLLAPVSAGDGEPAHAIAVHAARALRAAGGPLLAVVRPQTDGAYGELRALLVAQGCTLVTAAVPGPDHGAAGAAVAEGMGISIASAVRSSANAGGWIIALADMPWVRTATIAALRTAIAGGAASAAPYYRGQRGHPVGFAAVCRPALLSLQGDQGARAVLERYPPLRVEADDPGVLLDVDSPGDLRGAVRSRA